MDILRFQLLFYWISFAFSQAVRVHQPKLELARFYEICSTSGMSLLLWGCLSYSLLMLSLLVVFSHSTWDFPGLWHKKLFFIDLDDGSQSFLQYSRLENPMDGGAWWAAVHEVARSRIRLSDFTFTFHFHALEKEMVTHSSVFAWRIPGTGEPVGLPSLGSHRVGHDWRDLAAAAAAAAAVNHSKWGW